MNPARRPVSFPNKAGLRLFGILHEPPEETRRRVGIIILSPGVKMRVAPHRMYNKMAARFVALGFPVLRFDFYGLGDSEGEVAESYLADFYGTVQVGRYIEDTVAAMDWMERECGCSRFVLSGLCGGAITGLLSAARDRRADSILGLGIPVILDSTKIDRYRYLSEGQRTSLRNKYIAKLLDPKAWGRILTFRTDFRMLYRSFSRSAKKPAPKPAEPQTETGAGSPGASTNFNPYFPSALHRVLADRRALFIFSGSDRLYWEFEEKYVGAYQEELEKVRSHLDVHVTKDANHIFSLKEWQEDMLAVSCGWLEARYQRG